MQTIKRVEPTPQQLERWGKELVRNAKMEAFRKAPEPICHIWQGKLCVAMVTIPDGAIKAKKRLGGIVISGEYIQDTLAEDGNIYSYNLKAEIVSVRTPTKSDIRRINN